jgi:hypothetical protein
MKKLIGIILAVSLLTIGSVTGIALASPVFTVYDNDWSGWESAVSPYYLTEDFTDATLNPEVSVSSDNGYVDTMNGVWWDQLVRPDYGKTTTNWTFSVPIKAFGGTWDLAGPGGPGSNIQVLTVFGTWIEVGVINRTSSNAFWGFVSDVPIVQVHLQAYNDEGWCETYELDDMVYDPCESAIIDIKPGSYPNSINLKSKGVIPVAVLGSDVFDVTQIDPDTLRFCPLLGKVTPAHDIAYEDVNGDGYLDLVSHYRTQEIGLQPGQLFAGLIFMTYDNTSYLGVDSIRTVPAH